MNKLQVKTLRCAFILAIQHLLASGLEIYFGHTHSPFPQRKQPSLGAHRLDICTRQLVLGHHKLLEIHIF
jgi:hypothetical protein